MCDKRKRILNEIAVITMTAAIAGFCALSPVSASVEKRVPTPQANPQTPETIPLTPQQTATKGVAGKTVDIQAAKQAQQPKPALTEAQIREALTKANERRREILKPDPAINNRVLAEKWGVEVIGIKRTAGGYMLDFRFRVVDAEKSLPLFDHRIKPYMVADKSDIKLPVPMANKVGAFRPTNRGKNIKADKIYYMLFANPDNYVKSGEKISVVIGDFKVEDLTVN